MKSYIKNSLINDYIVIKSIHKKCVCFCNVGNEKDVLFCKATNLLKIYEKLIFKFGLMDLSFCLLNRELMGGINSSIEFENEQFKYYQKTLEEIEQKLTKKLKKLKINEFEAKFLVTDRCD